MMPGWFCPFLPVAERRPPDRPASPFCMSFYEAQTRDCAASTIQCLRLQIWMCRRLGRRSASRTHQTPLFCALPSCAATLFLDLPSLYQVALPSSRRCSPFLPSHRLATPWLEPPALTKPAFPSRPPCPLRRSLSGRRSPVGSPLDHLSLCFPNDNSFSLSIPLSFLIGKT
ncbi:basic proline-rich protein-like [Iris pallida]|uniref:Basic proline-rich protein-like n=1 Tax=Iris pallida TaxID=29817 RepID=A0AAX6G3Q1_IRIPA|nr:basic proline-rich protein-like [Iris pallida]